jgi:acyl dehydratase
MPEIKTDAQWNDVLDKFIAEENATKGRTYVPPPPWVLRKAEYEFDIIHELVTEDLIRHHADAVGDPNPLWRDPGYAKGTVWGGIIAPPTFEAAVAYGNPGMHMRFPGVNLLAAGNRHEYFKLIRPGDKFRIVDKWLGIEERTDKTKPYRLFFQNWQRSYVNQRDEVAVIAIGRTLMTAYPPSKVEQGEQDMYKDIKRHHFS